MIREAALTDVPRLLDMGRLFWDGSPWRSVGPFSMQKARAGFEAMIAAPNMGVFVIDADGAVEGAMSVLISDCWTVEGGKLAQELFWWVEHAGRREALALLQAGEAFAAAHGAPMGMIRLEGMRDAALDRLYRRRGYELKEHLYVRAV